MTAAPGVLVEVPDSFVHGQQIDEAGCAYDGETQE